MTTLITNPETLGGHTELIRALHDIDKRNQAARTRQAVIVGILLTLLGGSALTGRASADSGHVKSDDTTGYVLSSHARDEQAATPKNRRS